MTAQAIDPGHLWSASPPDGGGYLDPDGAGDDDAAEGTRGDG